MRGKVWLQGLERNRPYNYKNVEIGRCGVKNASAGTLTFCKGVNFLEKMSWLALLNFQQHYTVHALLIDQCRTISSV